jgi:hypothetical protein
MPVSSSAGRLPLCRSTHALRRKRPQKAVGHQQPSGRQNLGVIKAVDPSRGMLRMVSNRRDIKSWLDNKDHGMLKTTHDRVSHTLRNTARKPGRLLQRRDFNSLQGCLQRLKKLNAKTWRALFVVLGCIHNLKRGHGVEINHAGPEEPLGRER